MWGTQGQGEGIEPDAEFPTLEEAIEYVDASYGESCFRIEQPDGTDYQWPEDDADVFVLGFRLKPEEYEFNRRQKHYLKKIREADFFRKGFIIEQFRRKPWPMETLMRTINEFTDLSLVQAQNIIIEMIEWDMFEIFQIIPWAGGSGIKLEPTKRESWQ